MTKNGTLSGPYGKQKKSRHNLKGLLLWWPSSQLTLVIQHTYLQTGSNVEVQRTEIISHGKAILSKMSGPERNLMHKTIFARTMNIYRISWSSYCIPLMGHNRLDGQRVKMTDVFFVVCLSVHSRSCSFFSQHCCTSTARQASRI